MRRHRRGRRVHRGLGTAETRLHRPLSTPQSTDSYRGPPRRPACHGPL